MRLELFILDIWISNPTKRCKKKILDMFPSCYKGQKEERLALLILLPGFQRQRQRRRLKDLVHRGITLMGYGVLVTEFWSYAASGSSALSNRSPWTLFEGVERRKGLRLVMALFLLTGYSRMDPWREGKRFSLPFLRWLPEGSRNHHSEVEGLDFFLSIFFFIIISSIKSIKDQ